MTWKTHLTLIERNQTKVNVGVFVSPLSASDLKVLADPKAPYRLDSNARENDSYTCPVAQSCHIRCSRVVRPFDARCE